MKSLDREDRLRLMKFICSFAWADLQVEEAERDFVRKLVRELDLDQEEKELVNSWLEVPPRAEELDPAEIPKEHHEIFLETARAMIISDGKIAPDEAENFTLLETLLNSSK